MAKGISKTGDPLLDYVRMCINRNREARRPLEYRWYENAAFAAGFSAVEFDPLRGRPVSSASSNDESTNPQVQDKLRKYHAKIVAPRPMPECIPAKNDRDARKRAEVANALILHFWESQEYIYADHAAKLNMMVFGNAFFAMQWDPNAGEWFEGYEYVNDKPVYDTSTALATDPMGLPLLMDEPIQQVRSPRMKTWQSGLPRMRSVHPFNFFPDPQWRHLTSSQCLNYAERRLIPKDLLTYHFPDLDMDRVRGISAPEDAFLFRELDSSFGLRNGGMESESAEMVEVFDFYHSPVVMPSKKIDQPNGFRMVVVGDQRVSFSGSLPYGEFPHVTARDRQYTDRGWGMCITDVLRGAQRRLDLVERIQIRAAERTADPPLLKPQGTNDVSFQGRAGEIYEYVPYGEEKPSFMTPPQLPPNIFAMRDQALADMDSLSLTSAPVGGSTPSRGDSAAYLDRLLEENQVAMAPTTQELEAAQAHQSRHLIQLCQDHLPIGFKFALAGRDRIPHVEEFDGKPFNLLDVRIVPGSAAMTYPGQMRTAIMQLAANGILQDDSPKSSIITELMLGAPMAAKLTDLEEPGDRAVAELNFHRILDGREPFFKQWMDHERHIQVLLMNMRDPRFFLDLTVDQQQRLEVLLQQHQAAIAPPPGMMPGQEGGAQGVPMEGPPQGVAQVPAAAQGFAGPLGVAAEG